MLIAAALLGGCAKKIENADAVRQGVLDYLNKRQEQTGLNMASMDVTVTSVTFDKNTAKAMVSFKPKGDAAAGGMSKGYTLERQGDKWVVSGGQTSGMDPHSGGMGAAPGGMGMPAPGGAMPPNHPPVEGSGPEKK